MFITQLSAPVNKVLTELIKSGPNRNFSRTTRINVWSIESNAFSKSAEKRIPGNSNCISCTLICRPRSVLTHQCNHLLRRQFDLKWTSSSMTFLNLSAKVFEFIFTSTLLRKMGLQFFDVHLSRSFFSIKVITTCFENWKIHHSQVKSLMNLPDIDLDRRKIFQIFFLNFYATSCIQI